MEAVLAEVLISDLVQTHNLSEVITQRSRGTQHLKGRKPRVRRTKYSQLQLLQLNLALSIFAFSNHGGGGTSAKEALEGISTVDLTGQNTPAQAGQSRRGTLNRLHAGSGGRAAAGTAAGSLGDTIAPDD